MVGDVKLLVGVPGGQCVVDWFGGVPHFHDANLLEISLNSQGSSALRIHAWVMTDQVDDQGYFILDRHALVTITLNEVMCIDLTEFQLRGIIGDLEIKRSEDGYSISWGSSYGVVGNVEAKQISFELQPCAADGSTLSAEP